MKYYVYFIKNIINDKIYCGVTNNPKRRKTQHFSKLRNNNHIYKNNKPTKLQLSFNKYGEKNFIFKVMHTFEDEKSAYDKEIELIKKLDLINKGFNSARGGKGSNMWKVYTSEEKDLYSKKMSELISNLHKQGKIKKTNKCGVNNGMYGRHHSKETRKKISNANKGRKYQRNNKENYKRGKNSQAKKLILIFKSGKRMVFDCKPDLMDYFKENKIVISISTVKNLLKQDRFYETGNTVFKIHYYKGSTTRENIV